MQQPGAPRSGSRFSTVLAVQAPKLCPLHEALLGVVWAHIAITMLFGRLLLAGRAWSVAHTCSLPDSRRDSELTVCRHAIAGAAASISLQWSL